MTTRMRGMLASVCAALALTACVLLVGAHWQADAFSIGQPLAIHPARRAAKEAIPFPNGTVDVNTATAEVLCALDGVGPKTAQAILAEREANGPFDFPQDLLMVRGIGEKTLAKFYDQLDFSTQSREGS